MSIKKVLQHVDKNMSILVNDLRVLIRQPSVSAKNQGIKKCANLVKNTLKKSGIKAEILSMKDYPPVVYGEVKSKKNPNKTLLFYNHYDVQPVEPVELWDDDPFSGTIKGNKIYGRGSSDDKGELITRVRAIVSFLKVTGDVPCNVKFVIEGEEETGSAHIEEYLKKYRKKFSCDGVIWEFGHVDSKNRPIIDLGMKGLLYVELSLRESKMDAHSSLAVLIKNPAWRLVEAIKTLRDSSGKILIKDWYNEVQKLDKSDIKILKSFPFDEKEFRKEYGIKEFLGNKTGLEIKKSLVAEPTCNIAGIVSGYYGEGAKTVLPAEARVKIDFRLVPKMNPKKQVMRLKRHLKAKGFGDIEIKVYHGEAAARTNPKHTFVSDVTEAARRAFGKYVLSVSSAGTGPMYAFTNILKAPAIAIGSTYVFSRIHSPNEFARIDLLKKATKCMCLILDNFARSN
jgi:acetylornithine deacetylase/succinyl-diaminopimelate desuccinylase-like protein